MFSILLQLENTCTLSYICIRMTHLPSAKAGGVSLLMKGTTVSSVINASSAHACTVCKTTWLPRALEGQHRFAMLASACISKYNSTLNLGHHTQLLDPACHSTCFCAAEGGLGPCKVKGS